MLLYNPITNSQRHCCLINKKYINKFYHFKSFFSRKKSSFGRSKGRISSFHRFSGHKNCYRQLDFDFFFQSEVPFVVRTIEYDPNRSSFISLIYYINGLFSYIVATDSHYLDKRYICSDRTFYMNLYGNRTSLLNLPIGSVLSLLSTESRRYAQYIRSAGTYGILLRKNSKHARILLPSKKILQTPVSGMCFVGKVSNSDFLNQNLGKAGRSFWRGKKPIVRGVAMNPVDHPHGGGEGKKSKPSSPVNPWGTVIKYSRKFKRRKY
uniref:50S ribosomal protein L2 n=1 Tax=Pleurostomum flabellatum TaxID=405751 RepID=A0A7T0Q5L4_9EUKA|nr:50S ribosomal protein L2 [Pleurostomum flabellatum]QPL15609.1 50S ribosomal protein L2 [Pleurostomum flabellatum]